MKRHLIIKEFGMFVSMLKKDEQDEIRSYFSAIKDRIALSGKQNKLMISDFENALLIYHEMGFSVAESLKLIPAEKLGDFYKTDTDLWYPLDDAAKIYPMSMNSHWMAVFRLSFYLKSDVIPELLQLALNFTIKRFPYFATTIKKGFFWHYIDGNISRYTVMPESDFPCSPIDVSKSESPSFRVIFYKNRISVEYFHGLTDGTGGMYFLKTLTAEYLRLLGADIPFEEQVLDINGTPDKKEWANDFSKALPEKKTSGLADKSAMQLSGKVKRKAQPCRILHFDINSEKLVAAAKSKNATVTVFMLAIMFLACKNATDSPDGRIQIQVPVNIRSLFQSETLRNFSLYCNIRFQKADILDFDSLIIEIKNQLTEGSSKESLNKTVLWTYRLVRSLRFIPLILKHPIARLVYGSYSDKVFTNSLSNVGMVKVPENMKQYINKMDFVLGTPVTNRASCTFVTFNKTATLTITKLTENTSFEDEMYRLLNQFELTPTVYGSEALI